MKASEIIENDAGANNWSHAYLFLGADELEFSKIVDKVIDWQKCSPFDVSRVSPPDEADGKKGEIKVEIVRDMLHDLSLTPYGKSRVAVIYQADRLNLTSANILLKTLEEPPKNTIFLLYSKRENIIPTIRSRCRVVRLGNQSIGDSDFETGLLSKTFLELSKEVEEVVKNNGAERFLDSVENYLRGEMIRKKSTVLVRLIKKLESIRKEIRNNANQKLALESLILMIREVK